MRRVPVLLLCAGALSGCVLAAQHAKDAPRPDNAADAYIELSNAWLRIRDTGADSPGADRRHAVVMVHGYGSRLESFAAVQPVLSRSRRVISYDQRGFGMSERTKGDYGPAAHARDLGALVDMLGLNKPILVGHSYGGGVVLRAILDEPEKYGGFVLVDAFAMEEQIPPSFRWAKVPGLGEFIFATQFKEVVGEKYILAFSDKQRFASPAAIDEFRGNMVKPGAVYASLAVVRGMDYAPDQVRYKNITLPSAIIWGEDDRVTPLSAGKQLSGLVDNARFEVLSRCGHVPLWERPGAVVRTIEDLLAGIERGKPKPTPVPVEPVETQGVPTP
jgi:pimeloyl-ACP methyl ester carboxylesterase